MDITAIKVMHVASGDLWGGAEAQLYTLCKYLRKINGTSVVVALLNHGELEKKLLDIGLKVFIIDESTHSSLQIIKQLRHLIKTNTPDIIHTHRQKENILGSIAAYFESTISLRTVHGASEHPSGFSHPVQMTQHIIDNLCGKYLQKKIISVSYELEKQLTQLFPNHLVTTIENGVDIESLNHIHSNKKLLPPYKVGIVGRLVPVKRVDIFIEIANIWKKKHTDIPVEFHIFGDGPLRDELEKLSASNNTSNAVHFEGHCTSIHEEIKNLDALLITSDHEGLPMTLLESMSLETAVISNQIGGIPRALNQGVCGRLIHTQSAEAFSNELLCCLTQKEKTQKQIKLARERIDEMYSASINAKNIYTTYKELI